MASALAERRRTDCRSGRVWHAVLSEPLPAQEAGRAVLVALLNGPDGPRHELKTAWDDRRETSIKAIYRYLWRLGHGNRSGSYATTLDQLVAGLMPVMGWRDHGSRAENRSAHARSVARWLEDMRAMGLIDWYGVRDNQGRWWRTEIRLLTAPDPDGEWLAAAKTRLRAFARRERRRRSRNPRRRRDLTRVLGCSRRPTSRSARELAIAAAKRRRGAREACVEDLNLSSTPFGTLASLELSAATGSEPSTTVHSEVVNPHQSLAQPCSSGYQTGARAATEPDFADIPSATGHTRLSQCPAPPANGKGSIENGRVVCRGDSHAEWFFAASPEEVNAYIAQRQARIAAGLEAPPAQQFMLDTLRRAWESLASWPAGRSIPDRLMCEAFEHATGQEAKLSRDGRHRAQLRRALARYGRYSDQRPAGWPAAPEAALAHSMAAVAGQAQSVLYAIGHLDLLTKQMAGAHKRAHREHHEHAALRRLVHRDQRAASPTRTRFTFKVPATRRRVDFMSDEQVRLEGQRLFLCGELGDAVVFGFHVRRSDLIDGRHAAGGQHRSLLTWLRAHLEHREHQGPPLADRPA